MSLYRRKLNIDGKPIYPKKRWVDVKIGVIDTKPRSSSSPQEEREGYSLESDSSSPMSPSMTSERPATFPVEKYDEYEFTDSDHFESNKVESRLKPLPTSAMIQEPAVFRETIGSTNGGTTPIIQRKNFKKQIAMDWENRVRFPLFISDFSVQTLE